MFPTSLLNFPPPSAGALDVDVRDAATTHLLATGTLADTHALHRSGTAAFNSRSITLPDPPGAFGPARSPAANRKPHLRRVPSEEEMYICTPWSMGPAAGPPPNLSIGPGPDFRIPNPASIKADAGLDSFILQPPVANPYAVAAQIELPTSLDSVDRAIANPLYRAAKGNVKEERSRGLSAEQSARLERRNGGHAGLPPEETGGFLSAASTYLKTPYHSYMSAQVCCTPRRILRNLHLSRAVCYDACAR